MDEQLKDQQQLYDKGWQGELERGVEQRGNLRTNLDFLSQTNLLKPGDRILEIGCGIGKRAYTSWLSRAILTPRAADSPGKVLWLGMSW